jgi:hypothetical protein
MEASATGVHQEGLSSRGAVPFDSTSKILGLTVFASALLNFYPLKVKLGSAGGLQLSEIETTSPVESNPKPSQTEKGNEATTSQFRSEENSDQGTKDGRGPIEVGVDSSKDDLEVNDSQRAESPAPLKVQEKSIIRQDRHFSPPKAIEIAVVTRSALKRRLQERSIPVCIESESCYDRNEDKGQKPRTHRTSRGSQMANLVAVESTKRERMVEDDKVLCKKLKEAIEDEAKLRDVELNTQPGDDDTPKDIESPPSAGILAAQRASTLPIQSLAEGPAEGPAECSSQGREVKDIAQRESSEGVLPSHPMTALGTETSTPAGTKPYPAGQDAEQQQTVTRFQPLPRLNLQDDESPSSSPIISGNYFLGNNGNNAQGTIAMRTPMASDESPQTVRRLLEHEEVHADAGVRRVRFCVVDKGDSQNDKRRRRVDRRRSARAPKLRLSLRRSLRRASLVQLNSNSNLNDNDEQLLQLKLNEENSSMEYCKEENCGSSLVIARRLHQPVGLRKDRRTCRPAADEIIDGVPQYLREAYLNAKLADCWKHGDSWARLNLSGVEIGREDDLEENLRKVMTSVLKQRGESILDMALKTLQVEWEHLKELRQRYAGSPAVDGGPKSILRYASKFNEITPPLVHHRTFVSEPIEGDIVTNDMHLNVSPPEWQQPSSVHGSSLDSTPLTGSAGARTRSRGIRMIASINDLHSLANVDNSGLKHSSESSIQGMKRATKEVQSKITTRGQRLLKALKASRERTVACV